MKLTEEEKAERKRIKKEKRDKRNKVILTIILTIFGIFMILDGLAKIGQATSGTTETNEPKKKVDMVTEPSFVTGDFDVRYVSGKLQNNTNRDYDYCQVVIALYDSDGNLLGTTLDNTNSFKSGVTWLFNAVVLYEDAVSFEVDSVDYY